MSINVPFSTTLEVRDTCLCLHTQRAARALARYFDDALRPYGLTNGQFSLLMALNRPEPPSIAPVARLLAMDRTTLTAALKPLQKNALVEIIADSSDRRSRLLLLTPKGSDLLAKAVPVWREIHAELENNLLNGNGDMLRSLLLTLGNITPT
ncbi:MarR family transcriptional regulator [Bacillus subtilis]|uniref:MarR family winged helix-turn-helix transcriptional regulator n=1 Tax=Pseudochrobactrum asaccharolyticum TaxID=354351 RepID=UPI001EFF977C|nr:MarR family transcriptional regulator [Pseudochrobactrum asaccharolyticum]MCF7646188.1 MarR family transcriptional regulator [Pseudochrobactrum asaccharolyticum]MCF7672935.1 MarR family transcriptional regulator [Bacillus subtilis]